MKVETQQFGELEFTEELIVRFPKGLIGFEDARNFIIINHEDYEPFRWLISVDQKELGFPLLNPFLVEPNYGKDLPNALVERLFSADEAMDIFCVVTIKGEGGKVTINLKSPIIVDYQTKTGEQIILPSDDIPIAMPIS